MWILPKQLHTSAYVLDTKELGLDSEAFSQICEKSLTWRGKDSLSRTWLQRWKRESWMQHLSSRTLRPSHTESFVDAWTSSLEDSRVSHSQLLESVKLLKTPDTSSPTSQTELESANLELFSLKTYKESSAARQPTENQFSNMSSEHWKDWVIEQRQEYSQRKKSAHLIRESESTYLGWPTARTSDAEGGRIETEMTDQGFKSKRHKSNQTFGAKLRDAVETHEEQKNWPTATTRDWKDTNSTVPPSRANPSKQTLGRRVAHVGLQDQANPNTNGKSQESWATPKASTGIHPDYQSERERRTPDLGSNVRIKMGYPPLKTSTQTGRLNPSWVENLMGLPVGWTDLGSWETE